MSARSEEGLRTRGFGGGHLDSVIGIIGSSPAYSRRLADAINARRDVGYTAVAFGNETELNQFLTKKNLSVLLSDNVEHSSLAQNSCIFCLLTNEPDEIVTKDVKASVFKFQSASAIIKSVVLSIPESKKQFNKVFTVYSPGANAAASDYSDFLAKKLAETGKTLFLSWEMFGGLGHDGSELGGKTVSDLLFTARKNRQGMKKLLTGLMTKNGYDYFAGTEYYADLWQYSAEEMEALINSCRLYGNYENLVFCCGFFSNGIEALMEQSDEIYLVRHSISDRRNAEFMRQMKYAGKHEILTKIKEVTI